jgi:hypothetical protein
VCNTPTAAAALSSLGRTPATATPAVPRGRPAHARPAPPPPPRPEETIDVDCAGFRGRLLLAFPPLQIRVDSGELLGPLEFERLAGCARARAPGRPASFSPPDHRSLLRTLFCCAHALCRVLSKKWRHTVHIAVTGQPLGEWLDARGAGHLTARGVPPPKATPAYAYTAQQNRARAAAAAAAAAQRQYGFAPAPAYGYAPAPPQRVGGGYSLDAWTSGVELEEGEEEEEEGAGGGGGGGGGWRPRRRRRRAGDSDSEEYSPASRRRRAAARPAGTPRRARPAGAAAGRKRPAPQQPQPPLPPPPPPLPREPSYDALPYGADPYRSGSEGGAYDDDPADCDDDDDAAVAGDSSGGGDAAAAPRRRPVQRRKVSTAGVGVSAGDAPKAGLASRIRLLPGAAPGE